MRPAVGSRGAQKKPTIRQPEPPALLFSAWKLRCPVCYRCWIPDTEWRHSWLLTVNNRMRNNIQPQANKDRCDLLTVLRRVNIQVEYSTGEPCFLFSPAAKAGVLQWRAKGKVCRFNSSSLHWWLPDILNGNKCGCVIFHSASIISRICSRSDPIPFLGITHEGICLTSVHEQRQLRKILTLLSSLYSPK